MMPKLKSLTVVSLSLLAIFYTTACFGISYIVQDLGLTAGNSYASAINQKGFIVGKVKKKEGFFDFVWSPQTGLYIFALEASTSLPVINYHNKIVGTRWFKHFNGCAGGKSKNFYFADQHGIVEDIAPPSAFPIQKLESSQTEYFFDNHELAVLSINDKGQFLIADVFDSNKAKKFAVWMPKQTFWNKGEFKLIDDKKLNQAYFINNQGMILGKYWEKKETESLCHVALYDIANDSVTSIFLDKEYTLTGFNDAGQVCGWKVSHKGSHIVGFLWDPLLGMQSLGNFLPTAINNQGHMVGQLKTATTYLNCYLTSYSSAIAKIDDLKLYEWLPCVWIDNHAMPIQELVDTKTLPWSAILSLSGMNDKGEIIGQALSEQSVQAILLRPIPQ